MTAINKHLMEYARETGAPYESLMNQIESMRLDEFERRLYDYIKWLEEQIDKTEARIPNADPTNGTH